MTKYRKHLPKAVPTGLYNAQLAAFRTPLPNDPRWWRTYGFQSEAEAGLWLTIKEYRLGIHDDGSSELRYFGNYRDDDTLSVPTMDEFRQSGQDESFLLARG